MIQFYKKFGKRFFDLIIAVLVLILLAPIMLVIAALIKVSTSGKIIFVQDRVGKSEYVFTMYKFRTMLDKPRVSNKEIFLDDPELTKIGKWLRRFKLDELPQLINIIKGDMSFVGPRPILLSQFQKYKEQLKFRFEVLPGLTGLSQTSGNIYLTWEERFEYDLKYVKRIHFF
jgi:lipopolysaccharide/colanic/teichoic acid biosynthesis glycosyltransferase